VRRATSSLFEEAINEASEGGSWVPLAGIYYFTSAWRKKEGKGLSSTSVCKEKGVKKPPKKTGREPNWQRYFLKVALVGKKKRCSASYLKRGGASSDGIGEEEGASGLKRQ